MKSPNEELLTILAQCATACNRCSIACLKEPDIKMMTECIRLDLDCAQMCSLTAAFVSRGSNHAKNLLKECSEICKNCADECGKHAQIEHCKVCAEACRICSEACKAA